MKDVGVENNLLVSLNKINDYLIKENILFCLIGGLAVQIRGEPRFTDDIDICILSDLENQEIIIDKVISNFTPLVENPQELALSAQILPIIITIHLKYLS